MELTLEQLKLNEKLILLAIKTMQLHQYDINKIEEAINLHSVIKLRSIK